MFVCRACARRASNTFLHRFPATKPPFTAISLRAIATTSAGRQNHGTAPNQMEEFGGKTVNHNSNRPRSPTLDKKMQRAVKKELQWVRDPWHLADNIRVKLKAGEFEKALELTRKASSGDQVVVSWNHLIEHQLEQKKLHAAIKLFNEMKKRAQLPNAQTYTILFSGLAHSGHPTLAVGEALKIYNAMLTSQRLKPNVTHLNAVLEVCAKADDIESLFVTLRSATTERPPDKRTYTIILNALRYQKCNFVNPNTTLSEEEEQKAVKRSIKQTISRAKLVWEEVMTRWRKAEIKMDEELMCAMGRILLLGGPRETETILDMVTEILGITKLKNGQPGLMPERARSIDKSVAQPVKSRDTKENHETGGATNLAETTRPTSTSSSFQVLEQSIPPPVEHFMANNTLSLVMRALANSRLTKLGARYWDYLTSVYGVVPDRKNYRDYLDCLFTGAASGKAAQVIASMPPKVTEGQAIRRGLLMCYFDTFNSHAFDNATTMLDAMTQKLRYPDARCLGVYLKVALKAQHEFADETKYPTENDRKRGYGTQLYKALDRVWEPIRLATNHLGFKDGPLSAASPEEKSLRSYPERKSLIEVAETVQGLCDKMLSQRLFPVRSQEHKTIVARRQVMNNYITRWQHQVERPSRASRTRQLDQ